MGSIDALHLLIHRLVHEAFPGLAVSTAVVLLVYTVNGYNSEGVHDVSSKRIHIDVGGEGRYPHAINLNRFTMVTTTTGKPGRPIPNLVRGAGERMPFADRCADLITVENTPISRPMAHEIVRVIKLEGKIRLLNPADYAIGSGAHQRIIDSIGLGGKFLQSIGDTGNLTTLIVMHSG